MFEHARRPLQKDIVPAAAGFAVTFGAGMAVTLFIITGGFPDTHADRPAALWTNEVVAAEEETVALASLPTPPEPVDAVMARDVSERAVEYEPSPLDAAATPTHNVRLDTESIDSILANAAIADASQFLFAPPSHAVPDPNGVTALPDSPVAPNVAAEGQTAPAENGTIPDAPSPGSGWNAQ